MKANWVKVIQQSALLSWRAHVCLCAHACTYCSHQSPTCVSERVGACFSCRPAACVHEAERSCGFVYICHCVHMFDSETGRMQHSPRSSQSQAIPSGCEHLVNRLWPLRRPCFLTSIAVRRLLSTSLVDVKSLMSEPRELRVLNAGAEHINLPTCQV